MDVLEYTEEPNDSSISKIYDLQTKLAVNCLEIEAIADNIQTIELKTPEDFDVLEDLYYKEFVLYMNNIGLYEDLMSYIENEPKTMDNELILARIHKDAQKHLKVEVLQL